MTISLNHFLIEALQVQGMQSQPHRFSLHSGSLRGQIHTENGMFCHAEFQLMNGLSAIADMIRRPELVFSLECVDHEQLHHTMCEPIACSLIPMVMEFSRNGGHDVAGAPTQLIPSGGAATGYSLRDMSLALEVLGGVYDGMSYPLQIGSNSIGRDHEHCHYAFQDVAISRRHADVVVTESGVRIEDLGSLNGTYVNSEQTMQADLRPDDIVRIGNVTFRLKAKVRRPGEKTLIPHKAVAHAGSEARCTISLPELQELKKRHAKLKRGSVIRKFITGLVDQIHPGSGTV